MIIVRHMNAYKDPPVCGEDETLWITITEDQDNSITAFKQLIQRGLNCWEQAPKDLKDLGDMLTFGRITQDHTRVKMNTQQNPELPNTIERQRVDAYVAAHGFDALKEQVIAGKVFDIFAGKLV